MIYLELFFTFLKIGAFTFGGGYAMIPLIQSEVVAKGWMAEEEILNFIAVSESTPGPFAINIATYIGAETGGFFGAVCSTFGVVFPSLVIIILVAKFFTSFKDNRIVKGCMSGLRPTVIGLIASTALTVAISVFLPKDLDFSVFDVYSFVSSLIIFGLAAFLLLSKKKNPILIIAISAVLGIASGYLRTLF